MPTELEDIKALQAAEEVADSIWAMVTQWSAFEKDVLGKQMARAADSVGANIAEAYGRFHYGEKIRFLYYAHGSLFETKYWLNRTYKRGQINAETREKYSNQLSTIAKQINQFVKSLKMQKASSKGNTIQESGPTYLTNEIPEFIFEDIELKSLQGDKKSVFSSL